jgi:hypothetical protein
MSGLEVRMVEAGLANAFPLRLTLNTSAGFRRSVKSRHMIPLVAALAATMVFSPYFTTMASAGPPSIPSSMEVAVGYMDTERGAGAYHVDFPSPWCGSPGVQFIGSSTNYDGNSTDPSNCVGGDWDGGAILVTNTGAVSITLTGLTVTLPLPLSGSLGSPSCAEPQRPITFTLWFGEQFYYGNLSDPAYDGGPITIAPAGQAIFAETSSDGAEVCPSGNYPAGPTGGSYDFDTSDANFLSGCTLTTDTVSDPQITFSATGYVPTTYIDKGHVIDTGGIDTGMCSATAANPEWPNESLGWRVASSTCGEGCTTNQLAVPSPTSARTSAAAASAGPRDLTPYFVAAVVVVAAVGLVGFGLLQRKKAQSMGVG